MYYLQLIALILGVIYLDQDYKSQDGVMNVNGALFLILSNMTFQTMFAVINVSVRLTLGNRRTHPNAQSVSIVCSGDKTSNTMWKLNLLSRNNHNVIKNNVIKEGRLCRTLMTLVMKMA